MSESARSSAVRRIAGIAARVFFVIGAVGFAIWSFRDDWPSIGSQITAVPALSLVAAVALIALGVVSSLPMWSMLARAHGVTVPPLASARVVLVGQLGKYLPGAVWPVAAQTQMLRQFGVPLRSSVSIGLLYVSVHFASSVGFGSIVALAAGTPWNFPSWIPITTGICSFLVLVPSALRFIARMASGPSSAPQFTWCGTLVAVACTGATWATWSLASIVIASSSGIRPESGIAIVEAVLLGYAAGVAVVIAPAGLGVREGVVIAITAPSLGLPAAAALAILSRVVSALADIGVAAAAWILPRLVSGFETRQSRR